MDAIMIGGGKIEDVNKSQYTYNMSKSAGGNKQQN